MFASKTKYSNMKPSKLIITVPNPCHQNLSDMQAAENGRFCTHCNKTVIDFTAMTNQQLFDFFKNNKINVCGSFYSDQLNTTLTPPHKPNTKFSYIFTFLIGLFIQLKTFAQNTIQKQKISLSATQVKKNKTANTALTIKGKIIDSSNMPISYATVLVKQNSAKFVADELGNFTITVPTSKKQIQLVVSHLNYSAKFITINTTKKINAVEVKLQSKSTQLEEVAVKALSYQIRGKVMIAGGAVVVYPQEKKLSNCNDSLPKANY